ncbi:hypothetical protein [Aureibacter tunicatorum]|uniref:Uncharacterized protein n=1 Tax=Aureibacter tunicatorum TaxID=866807 RepID=A0AAE3XTE1_9BACT|nr:hypothetical protein [Aureibacter tunicatorum]MDR6241516.1 hypothetical protein [Aureibacter tunicatorum]BDD07026.1 hypothetical protein AUTU_45090 [Aureibacter tunicatorum]
MIKNNAKKNIKMFFARNSVIIFLSIFGGVYIGLTKGWHIVKAGAAVLVGIWSPLYIIIFGMLVILKQSTLKQEFLRIGMHTFLAIIFFTFIIDEKNRQLLLTLDAILGIMIIVILYLRHLFNK